MQNFVLDDTVIAINLALKEGLDKFMKDAVLLLLLRIIAKWNFHIFHCHNSSEKDRMLPALIIP